MDVKVGIAQDTDSVSAKDLNQLCWANRLEHEAIAKKMVSKLHGIPQPPAFLPPKAAFVGGSLSPTRFDRIQLELFDCGLANGLPVVHWACD